MDDPDSRARIEVFCTDEGDWLWSYRSGEAELISNHTFADPAEALASARRAYPHLPEDSIHVGAPPPRPAERRKPGSLLVGLGLIALAWRNRRSPRRAASMRKK